MNKNILLTSTSFLVALVFGSSTLLAQNSLQYTEDFDVSLGITPPTGWTTTNNQSNTSNNAFWKFGNYSGSFNYDTQGTSDNTGNGSLFAWVDGSSPYPAGLRVDLETKSFDFTNHWNLMLEFYHVSYNVTYTSDGYNTFDVDYYDGAMWHFKVFTQKGNNPSAAWTKKSIDLSSMQPQGTEQVKFRFSVHKDAAGFSFYNDIGIDDFSVEGEEAMLGMNNAAALGKVRETVCLGNQDIDVLVSNRGTNQIDSVEVHWTVDGVAQPMVMYNQTLDTLTGTGPHTAIVTLGQVNFAFGIPRTIKYWTSMPNSVQDTVNDNDTLDFVQYAALAGKYTVGGGGSDLPDLDTVAWLLNNVGVCGPVTFELKDSTFVSSLMLDRVPGNNSINTITFESKGGDPSMCTITDTTRNSVTNYTVVLDTTNNVMFKNVTISNGSISTYAGVIDIKGGAHNIAFENCHIMSGYSGSSTTAYLVNSAADDNTDEISFEDCVFENGSWAIRFEGTQNNPQNGLYVDDCMFLNNTRSAIWARYVSDIEIYGNTMTSNSTNTGTAAMYITDAAGYIEIYGNHITHSASWPQTGISLLNTAGLSTKHNLIMNNAFTIGDTSSTSSTLKRGLYCDNVAFLDVYFNTMAISTTNTSSYAFGISNSNGNLVANNVFANMGAGGVAVDVSGLGSILNMDNNLLYCMTGDLGKFSGTAYSDLAQWQSNTGFDAGSVSEDPMFRAIDTLKMCSKAADNIASASGLITDIEGNLRDPLNPDPGAFEYSAITGITVDDQNICDGDEAFFRVAGGSNDVIIWNFNDTSNTFKTNMGGTYTLTAIGECGADTTNFGVHINKLVSLSNDTNICGGDTLMVMSDINGAMSYDWNTGETTQSIGIYKTGQYYVNVTDSDGCFSSDTIEVITSQVAVLRADTGVCEGQTVMLDPNTPAGSYTWYRDGISISTQDQIFADSAGNYVVLYIDAKNCSSSDTFNLTTYALPTAGFTTGQSQNNLQFTANDTTGTNYFWSFGDGKSVNGPAWQTLNNYAANGTYSVTLTVTSAKCGDATNTEELEVMHVGYREYVDGEAISIFPNPSNGIINIEGSLESVTAVEVIAASGQVVYTKDVENAVGSISVDISTAVTTGVYYLQLKSDNAVLFTNKIAIK